MNSKTPHHENRVLRGLLMAGMLTLTLVVLSGCTAHTSHRQRHVEPEANVSFEYYYYPEQHVYYDRHRHIYHYHHQRHGWLAVKRLPAHIRLNHHGRHPLVFRHNRPWNERHAHKRQHRHQDDRRQQEPREKRYYYQYEKSPTPHQRPEHERNENNGRHNSGKKQLRHGRDEKIRTRQKQLGHERNNSRRDDTDKRNHKSRNKKEEKYPAGKREHEKRDQHSYRAH